MTAADRGALEALAMAAGVSSAEWLRRRMRGAGALDYDTPGDRTIFQLRADPELRRAAERIGMITGSLSAWVRGQIQSQSAQMERLTARKR